MMQVQSPCTVDTALAAGAACWRFAMALHQFSVSERQALKKLSYSDFATPTRVTGESLVLALSLVLRGCGIHGSWCSRASLRLRGVYSEAMAVHIKVSEPRGLRMARPSQRGMPPRIISPRQEAIRYLRAAMRHALANGFATYERLSICKTLGAPSSAYVAPRPKMKSTLDRLDLPLDSSQQYIEDLTERSNVTQAGSGAARVRCQSRHAFIAHPTNQLVHGRCIQAACSLRCDDLT